MEVTYAIGTNPCAEIPEVCMESMPDYIGGKPTGRRLAEMSRGGPLNAIANGRTADWTPQARAFIEKTYCKPGESVEESLIRLTGSSELSLDPVLDDKTKAATNACYEVQKETMVSQDHTHFYIPEGLTREQREAWKNQRFMELYCTSNPDLLAQAAMTPEEMEKIADKFRGQWAKLFPRESVTVTTRKPTAAEIHLHQSLMSMKGLNGIEPIRRKRYIRKEPGGTGGYINQFDRRVPNPCKEVDMQGRDMDKIHRWLKPEDKEDAATLDRLNAIVETPEVLAEMSQRKQGLWQGFAELYSQPRQLTHDQPRPDPGDQGTHEES